MTGAARQEAWSSHGKTKMPLSATREEMGRVLARIERDVPGFIACSLVDLDYGVAMAAHSPGARFDLEEACVLNSELVKRKQRTIQSLNLSSTLEDMLLTLSDQLHLIKMVGEGAFIYLAADRAVANLAVMRQAVTKHTKEIH